MSTKNTHVFDMNVYNPLFSDLHDTHVYSFSTHRDNTTILEKFLPTIHKFNIRFEWKHNSQELCFYPKDPSYQLTIPTYLKTYLERDRVLYYFKTSMWYLEEWLSIRFAPLRIKPNHIPILALSAKVSESTPAPITGDTQNTTDHTNESNETCPLPKMPSVVNHPM